MHIIEFLGLGLISFSFSLFLIQLILKYLTSKKFFDDAKRDPLKIHQKPISFLGGIGISIPFFVSLILANSLLFSFKEMILPVIFVGALVISIGLWDDLKKIPPIARISLEIMCGLILILFGIHLSTYSFYNPVSIIFVLIYLIGTINAVNMQDGMDGLAGGLVIISLIGFFVISISVDNVLGMIVSLCLLGPLMAFLIFNFPPASVFMGDNGSYFLGFVLAFLAINNTDPVELETLIGPLLLIGLPVLDATYAVIRRVSRGVSPFSGDRSHFYDQLLKHGFSVKRTLLICWGFQFAFVIFAVLIYL